MMLYFPNIVGAIGPGLQTIAQGIAAKKERAAAASRAKKQAWTSAGTSLIGAGASLGGMSLMSGMAGGAGSAANAGGFAGATGKAEVPSLGGGMTSIPSYK